MTSVESATSESDEGVLVETTSDDRHFDYCLEPYAPRRSPVGGLRAESLLWHSFRVAGAEPRVAESVRTLQHACGRDATVWGVKYDGRQFFWELYFYDPQKRDAAVTATRVRESVAPFYRIDAVVRETVPYFMFSYDLAIDTSTRGVVDGLNLYLAEPRGHAGRSYKVQGERMELENHYVFLPPKTDIEEVLARVRSSTFVDFDKVSLAALLRPQLFSCRRVCVARKRSCDALYFSGIDVDQWLWFLRAYDYPRDFVSFAERWRGRFEHLRFDVGIDYRSGPDGHLLQPKTSFYGTV